MIGRLWKRTSKPRRIISAFITMCLLIAAMITALTAAQISHAFLVASGGRGGVSAVAVFEAANALDAYNEQRRKLEDDIAELREDQALNQAYKGDVAVLSYIQKVQFRRFVFGCFPAARARSGTEAGTESLTASSDLSWAALLELYMRAGEIEPSSRCALVDTSTPVPPGLLSARLDPATQFKDCRVSDARLRLNCLWDNVTTSVQFVTALDQKSDALAASLIDRQTQVAQLEGAYLGKGVLADPAGRSAVATWIELYSPGDDLNIGERLGRIVAAGVVLPLLLQSAILAVSAGAVGGGLAHFWEIRGYDRSPSGAPRRSGRRESMALSNAVVSGGGSALVLWLLTTSGLFVLSGGDSVASASPSILLAMSLAAGLAYRAVIFRIFEMTENYLAGDSDDDEAPKPDAVDLVTTANPSQMPSTR